ncbi:MAG: conjugal transfer protein TraG, partial [Porphyromonadaceae bacterium]|nr:conjugal transfer protein TraG [Porphyromonadaceae bacterium]
MTLYVILFFFALLGGMAISVAAFGTGGKRKKIFQDIYFSVEDNKGVGVIYTKTGEYSAVLKLINPVQKYSANIDSYYEFTHLFTALAQTLGEGYAIHKQDIFTRKQFKAYDDSPKEFLSESYFRYFTG